VMTSPGYSGWAPLR